LAFLFKNGEQLYTEGLDMIGRRDFSGAKKKFTDATQKGYTNDGLAQVYIGILDVGANRSSLGCYKTLRNALGDLKINSFKFGLTDIDVADLIAETELDIKEIEANNLPDSLYKEKSAALIACAEEFMARIGEKNLKFDEIFKGTTAATGNREALILQAEGYYVLGEGSVSEDPKMASEYMQMSYNFRRQLGDSGDQELKLAQDYARSARCWICGRPANGEGIHFQPMRSTIAPVFAKETEGDIVKPISEDVRSIYVCVPCYTAISNRSDDISRVYYERAMAEVHAIEARLEAEIASVRFSASMHR